MATSLLLLLSLLVLCSQVCSYSPFAAVARVQRRDYPTFPDDPPSCPICAQNYAAISSCAQAAPVFANFSMIIFNPGAFVDVIQCACTDTFQSTYPQCVDCFIQTNQTQYLDPSNSQNLPSVVAGMRQVCAIASTLLGGVATADGEVTPTSSGVPAATGTSAASTASTAPSMTAALSLVLVVMMGIVC